MMLPQIRRYADVLLPIFAWQASSIFVIFANKHLYSASFSYPLTLMFTHMVLSTAATQALALAGLLLIPQLGWRAYLRLVVPLGFAFALSVALSNLAAARLPIASIQMTKSLAPLFTLSAMFAAGGAAKSTKRGTALVSPAQVTSVLCLTLGGALVNLGDLHFDAAGLGLQLCAMLCEALRMVAVSGLLSSQLQPRSNPLVALALFAPVCACCLLPLALLVERGALPLLAGSPQVAGLVALSALGALSLNCCSVWLLSRDAGPLLVSLAGVAKDMAVVLLSVAFLGNAITRTQTAGYALALVGLNLHRMQSAAKEPMPLLALVTQGAGDPVTLAIACGICAILAANKWV